MVTVLILVVIAVIVILLSEISVIISYSNLSVNHPKKNKMINSIFPCHGSLSQTIVLYNGLHYGIISASDHESA